MKIKKNDLIDFSVESRQNLLNALSAIESCCGSDIKSVERLRAVSAELMGQSATANEGLIDIDSRLGECIEHLKVALIKGSSSGAQVSFEHIDTLLAERSIACLGGGKDSRKQSRLAEKIEKKRLKQFKKQQKLGENASRSVFALKSEIASACDELAKLTDEQTKLFIKSKSNPFADPMTRIRWTELNNRIPTLELNVEKLQLKLQKLDMAGTLSGELKGAIRDINKATIEQLQTARERRNENLKKLKDEKEMLDGIMQDTHAYATKSAADISMDPGVARIKALLEAQGEVFETESAPTIIFESAPQSKISEYKEVEALKKNVDQIIAQLRKQSFVFEEKIAQLKEEDLEVCSRMKKLLQKRESSSGAECTYLDNEIETLNAEHLTLKTTAKKYLQAKSTCDARLCVADAVKNQEQINLSCQLIVNGERIDLSNFMDESAMYLKNAASIGNEELKAARMAADVAFSEEIDVLRNASQSVLEGGVIEEKDDHKFDMLKKELGLVTE